MDWPEKQITTKPTGRADAGEPKISADDVAAHAFDAKHHHTDLL